MILLIGGTGTLGKEIARLTKCRVYSRNEYWQWLTKQELPYNEYVIGDVRDYDALREASEGCTRVINCAALKHIDHCDENPSAAVKSNIIGAENVLRLDLPATLVSTDKAVNPSGLYGATKLVAEHLFLLRGQGVVRLPNLYGSSGSVIELWRRQHELGVPLTVTDKLCYRYFIDPVEAAKFVLEAKSGLNIPLCQEYNIWDLCEKLYPEDEKRIIGLRPNEKLREVLA